MGFFGGPVDFLIHWPPGPVVATVQCQGLLCMLIDSQKEGHIYNGKVERSGLVVRAVTDYRVVTGSNPTKAVWKLTISFTPLCQCILEETLKAVDPFYLVSMPGK